LQATSLAQSLASHVGLLYANEMQMTLCNPSPASGLSDDWWKWLLIIPVIYAIIAIIATICALCGCCDANKKKVGNVLKCS
jgi:hypothetical protein